VPQQEVELILARQLAGGLSVPILLVDAQGETLFFNESAELLLGRRLDEIDQLGLEERASLLAPRDADGHLLPVDDFPSVQAMRERRPAHAAIHLHGLDGVLRPVEVTAIPVQSGRGHVLGAIVVLWAQERRGPSALPAST
jgi:PAS domain-containing protein